MAEIKQQSGIGSRGPLLGIEDLLLEAVDFSALGGLGSERSGWPSRGFGSKFPQASRHN